MSELNENTKEKTSGPGPGATIVSAFMTNINYRADRHYTKYIELAKPLLMAPINKVIFVDKNVFNDFILFINENTTIIPFVKESNYLYQYEDEIDNSVLETKNPDKDTKEYMFTMCYKTEFVRKAMIMNNYGASQFIWLDLGIKHMIQVNSDKEFVEKIMRLKYVEYSVNIRIACIWNPDYVYQVDLYKDICWYFAGSIFGGNIKSLTEFADLTRGECLKMIKEKKQLVWEINIWQLIYRLDRWRFLYYISSHDNSILDLY